jgi:predicted ATPase/DNA-binding CsgD family transcriptional regulator
LTLSHLGRIIDPRTVPAAKDALVVELTSSVETHPKPPSDQGRDPKGNLPSPLTSLIGRDAQITSARSILVRDDVRLITFTGPGGVGKTQLALAIARTLSADFADGVVFVPLAPIREPGLVASAVAQVFHIPDTGSSPLIDRLIMALRTQETLLVLDNFEHVVLAAPLIADLLSACPRLKLVVTSRALLSISGEHAFPVPPLALPSSTRSVPIDELADVDAVRLFITRAQEVNPDFKVTEANASAVAGICRNLDGLPLAIELAAARVRALSPPALLAQMTSRLPLLTGGRRDAPARLQTMRHAIAWSYDLLSPAERRLFRHLSVFVGGFMLEAAKAVMADRFVLDDLVSLVDKSLVEATERPDGDTRYTMLETIREFGLDELAANGEAADVKSHHAAYFLAFAERPDRVKCPLERFRARHQLDEELPNLRVALAWVDDQADGQRLLRLTTSLFRSWFSQGLWDEASTWQAKAIEATTPVPPALQGLRAKLLANTARIQNYRGNFERASMLLGEASALAAKSGDTRATAEVEFCLGHLAIWRGDLEKAEPHLDVALALWRALDEPDRIATTLCEQGYATRLKGDLRGAEKIYAEAIDAARADDWEERIASILERLGVCVLEQGEYQRAAEIFVEALTLVQDVDAPLPKSNCIRDFGVIAAAARNPVQAARLFGASQALWERHGFGQPATLERPRLEQAMAPARTQLTAEAFAAAWAAGRGLSLDQAIAEALAVAKKFTSDSRPDQRAPAGLTSRELEVLRLIVEGLANKEIAESLGISRHTVSKHIEAIFSKLDVSSRTAAATFASRHKLV